MIQIYEEHGCEIRHEPLPEGWVEVNIYNPHSTPWDYYGSKHLREYCQVLTAAGIENQGLITHRRSLYPMGSGPQGRVRFGDDMQPGVYRVAVQSKDEAAARVAIAAHKEAIDKWLYQGGTIPEACRLY